LFEVVFNTKGLSDSNQADEFNAPALLKAAVGAQRDPGTLTQLALGEPPANPNTPYTPSNLQGNFDLCF
jgi:hypothetical protein